MRRLALFGILFSAACTLTVDRGAGKSVTQGANVLAPGDWSDAIQGDGEILGAAAANEPGSGKKKSSAPAESSATDSADPSDGASSSTSSSGSSGSSGSGGKSASGSSGSSGSSGASGSTPGADQDRRSNAGLLTAGTWDDNENFRFFQGYQTLLRNAQVPGLLPFADAEHADALARFQAARAPRLPKVTLDVQLVIDTTGSMGDEIRYLQNEFDDLAATIQSKYPTAAQRWSLVLYKDVVDSYVVRWFDFRPDTQDFRAKLATAFASGGGDLPEASEQALGISHRLSWRRDDATARVVFWVADAPHHDQDAPALANAIRSAKNKGIHIYPVAASGTTDLAEYAMRSAAQLTGGRYLFLTNDSGIGNLHMEPRIPCYYVTTLNQAILRMIDVELGGRYREPTEAEIVRTGGDPRSGSCTLQSGYANAY